MVSQNVFLVLPWSPEHQGGVTGVTLQLIENWPTSDPIRLLLAVNDWNHPSGDIVSNVFYFRFTLIGKKTIFALVKALMRAPFILYRTRSLLLENNIGAVNFHYPGLGPLGVALLKRLGLFKGRLILSYHGTDVHTPRDWLEKYLFSFLFNSADALVACSESLANRMTDMFNLERQRITVIYNGVNIDVFKPNSPQIDQLTQQLPESFILSVGAFIPRKSQKTLLGAFGLLANQFPKLHLCLAGADGPDRIELIEYSRQLGFEDRVHFFINIGPREVAYLLSRAILCVQTALAESFPLAVLEAGAVGVPLAVTRIEGHDELIFEDKTGRLFSADDPADCASVVARSLTELDQARAMADNFRVRILNDLTWTACISKYRYTYQQH